VLPGKTYNVETIANLLWRRKWLILLPFVLCGAAAFVVSSRMPDLYMSETSILVVPQRVPESYVRSTVSARIEDRLRTINQQTLSRTRLEQIINEFDLYAEARTSMTMEAVVNMMRGSVIPEIVRADSFRLSFVYTDPVLAMKVTERLASLYIEENIRDREVVAEGTNQFLEDQLNDARSRLLEHERKLEAYRLRHSGELPSQLPSNLQVIQNAQMQIQSVLEALNRDRDRRAELDRQIADQSVLDVIEDATPPPAGETPPVGSRTALQELSAANAQLAALERRLTPAHPDVVRQKSIVADLEVKVAKEAAARRARGDDSPSLPLSASPAEIIRQNRLTALRAERKSVDGQIAAREKEEEQLRATIGGYQARVEMVPTREAEMVSLTRDYDTLQAGYRALLQKKEESQMAASLERQQSGEQFRVLDAPRVPEKPFRPNRPVINLAGSIVGLLLGLGIVGLLEFYDSALRTETDVIAALELPVLAVVPLVAMAADVRRRRIVVTAVTLVVAAAAAVGGWTLLN
jgi:polysaccharide chain length determinant protein (PEP-CTERM system associated)